MALTDYPIKPITQQVVPSVRYESIFSNYKFVFAKNRVVHDLFALGRISKNEMKLMKCIAGNPANRSYGVTAIKLKFVTEKYTAVAAIFARIAAVAAIDQKLIPADTAENCVLACMRALQLSGVNEKLIDVKMQQIIYEHGRVLSDQNANVNVASLKSLKPLFAWDKLEGLKHFSLADIVK